jgi:hypothetical protein
MTAPALIGARVSMMTLTARCIAGRFFALPSYEARGTPFPVMMLLNWTVSDELVMSWRQSNALTLLLVGLLTVTGLWMLVLVAVPISGALSLMAGKRRQEAAAKTERDAGQRVDAIRERASGAFLSNIQ